MIFATCSLNFCICTSVVPRLIEVGGFICVFCETGLGCSYEVRLRAALVYGMVEVCLV